MKDHAIRVCPLCNSFKGDIVFKRDYTLARCRRCGLTFVHEQPDFTGKTLYDENYYRGASEYKDNLANENVLDLPRVLARLESCRSVVDLVMTCHPNPGAWLDIGCGPGFLLSQAAAQGWTCTGIDPSPFATDFARLTFGLTDVHTALVEDADFEEGRFDVISMQHVIEHFFYPLDTMRRIAKWLKTGGLLYLETPDIGSPIALREGACWEHIKLPEHVVYFSEGTLKYLLDQIKFEMIVLSHPVKGTGLMNRLCGGQDQARRFYDRFRGNPIFSRVIRAVRRMNEWYRFRLRGQSDILHLMARKKG